MTIQLMTFGKQMTIRSKLPSKEYKDNWERIFNAPKERPCYTCGEIPCNPRHIDHWFDNSYLNYPDEKDYIDKGFYECLVCGGFIGESSKDYKEHMKQHPNLEGSLN